MTAAPPQVPQPGFGTRLGRAFLFILRLGVRVLVILAVVALLGLAFFYGIPYVHQHIIQPLEENRAQLAESESTQSKINVQMTEDLGGMRANLATLQAQSTDDAQLIRNLQSRLDELESSLKQQLGDAQGNLTSALDRLDQIDAGLEDLGQDISQLSTRVSEDGMFLEALSTKVDQEDPTLAALRREVQLVKAMELVTRARLFLGQSNYGLARQDVVSARQILADLAPTVLDFQVEGLYAIVGRLDMVVSNLPASPVLASDDLEIAWQMLVAGLPEEPAPLVSATVTPIIIQTSTPTATVTIQLTPTLTETVGTSTPTPTSSTTPKP